MTFNENTIKKLTEVGELVISKQRDYGTRNILGSPIKPELAVLVRLNDKLARAANLLSKELNPSNESLKDTYMDIIGYGLILLMLEDNTFELELE